MKKLLIINILLIIIVIKVPLKVEVIETAKEEIKEKTEEIKQEIIEAKPVEEKPVVSNRSQDTKREIMTTSAKGIEMIKRYEGCRLNSYKLPNESYYTIGYGHYSSENYAGQQITQGQAEAMLKNDLQRFEGHVRNKCKHLNLNQNEFDALVSFTFNCGQGNLNKLVRNRSKEEIAKRMINYTKSGSSRNKNGLQRRRLEEQKLFLGGI